MTQQTTLISIADSSSVASARRAAIQCAESMRLSEAAAGHAALVATEMATNLVKHASGGSILIAPEEGDPAGVTLISIDQGDGIGNVGIAMSDGFSTSGSPGTGLGAIARAASRFDVYSLPAAGTAILCRIVGRDAGSRPSEPRASFEIGGICVPMAGETEAGDSWAAVQTSDGMTIALADGLGHGDAAAEAARRAMRTIRENPEADLGTLIEDTHAALRSTRGAALAIARVRPLAGRVDFIGVGNIAGTVVGESRTRKTVSYGGIIGHELRKVQTFSYDWSPSSVLLLHSDGVSASWQLEKYPGLLSHDAALIAAVIFRDWHRTRDDASIVVAKAIAT